MQGLVLLPFLILAFNSQVLSRNITVGYLTYIDWPVVYELFAYWPMFENSASAISLAIEDFTATGALKEHNIK